VSIGIEKLSGELDGAPGAQGNGDDAAATLRERLALWEDLLTLVVDPESARVQERERRRRVLSYLL